MKTFSDLMDLVDAIEMLREGYDPYYIRRRLGKAYLEALGMPFLKALRDISRDWFRICLLRKILARLGVPLHVITWAAVGVYFVKKGLLNEDELCELVKRRAYFVKENFVREALKIYDDLVKRLSEVEEIALYEHYIPRWLLMKLKNLMREDIIALCRALRRKRLWIRVNTLKAEINEVIKELEGEGFIVEEDKDIDFVLKVVRGDEEKLRRSRVISEGLCFIQDKGSVLVVLAMDLEPGNLVVDYCAAPGMKTTLIAQLLEGKGTIIAVDISRKRLMKMKRILRMAGAKDIQLLLADSRKLSMIKAEKALVDPPCTSTGALSKDPSIALRLKRRHIRRYSRIQRDIMRNIMRSAESVVYSVCSFLPEEGEAIIDQFINQEARPVKPFEWPHRGWPGYRCSPFVIRLHPHLDECNGFFIAKLSKRS